MQISRDQPRSTKTKSSQNHLRSSQISQDPRSTLKPVHSSGNLYTYMFCIYIYVLESAGAQRAPLILVARLVAHAPWRSVRSIEMHFDQKIILTSPRMLKPYEQVWATTSLQEREILVRELTHECVLSDFSYVWAQKLKRTAQKRTKMNMLSKAPTFPNGQRSAPAFL